MVENRSLFYLLVIFVIMIWVWGPANPALSETLSCKSETKEAVRSDEQVESLYDTGYFIGITASEGAATCEDGETIEVKSYSLWASNWPKETVSQVITRYRFKDVASIIVKGTAIQNQDPKGEAAWLSEGASEIIKGTGRFKGIKGNLSYKSKQLPPDKRIVSEFTMTYTLPPR